eukprot:4732814-Prymnesium_polylepis.1
MSSDASVTDDWFRWPSCSRLQRPLFLVTREEDQHFDQAPATRRCTGCSNQGEKKPGRGVRLHSTEEDRGLQDRCSRHAGGSASVKRELWAAGSGFANRCERLVRGECSRMFAQDSAPDCTDLRLTTMEMHLPTSFVRLIASFA